MLYKGGHREGKVGEENILHQVFSPPGRQERDSLAKREGEEQRESRREKEENPSRKTDPERIQNREESTINI